MDALRAVICRWKLSGHGNKIHLFESRKNSCLLSLDSFREALDKSRRCICEHLFDKMKERHCSMLESTKCSWENESEGNNDDNDSYCSKHNCLNYGERCICGDEPHTVSLLPTPLSPEKNFAFVIDTLP